MNYDNLFRFTGIAVWITICSAAILFTLAVLWEALGTAIFVYKLWRGANFARMRRPFRVWAEHFGGPHTSICFRNTGVVVRWPRPWYDREADLQLSWNQIPFEDEQ